MKRTCIQNSKINTVISVPILALLVVCAGCANQEDAPSQTALSPQEIMRRDSLSQVQKAKDDSLLLVREARRDSIEAAREQERIRLQPCMDAFQAAASVSAMQDTHSDLFPAYFACSNLDDWEKADSVFPNALDGASPVIYAMNVCDWANEVAGSPICEAVKSAF